MRHDQRYGYRRPLECVLSLLATNSLLSPAEYNDDELCSAFFAFIAAVSLDATRNDFDDSGRLTVSSRLYDMGARISSHNYTSGAALCVMFCRITFLLAPL